MVKKEKEMSKNGLDLGKREKENWRRGETPKEMGNK